MEVDSNTSTVALRVAGGDEKGTQCLGAQLDQPVPRVYKCGDLALHIGEVLNLRQENMVMGHMGLRPNNDCTSKGQQQL
jgi:hypothetical protein